MHTVEPRGFLSPLRDRNIILGVVRKIHRLWKNLRGGIGDIRIMNFCGTHEYTITYYGIRSLMPEGVELIAGPGCPVCVTPAREVDEAIEISRVATLLTYGDMYKVPGTRFSLSTARSRGASVRVVYGFNDAVKIARREPDREFVFFAVGFETTAPTVASYVAKNMVPKNMALLMSYRITVPIMRYILESKRVSLHGIIAPGHVSTIIGAGAWGFVADEYGIPIVVAGFEPLDVVVAIYEILKQISSGEARLINEYSRVVSWNGNIVAKKYIEEAFIEVDGSWRGIGVVPRSVWHLRDKYLELDARQRYEIKIEGSVDIKPGCRCADIVLGLAKPTDCKYFGKACTPDHPLGPCMVSSEGTCSIWFRYGGHEVIRRVE